MQYRQLGRTGWQISEVSFGAWAIGGTWGDVNEQDARAALRRAVDLGINFFDTADVYGDGRSERLLSELKRQYGTDIVVATKAGRRLDPHTAEGYTAQNLGSFVDRSLRNLQLDAIDLLQLHCPPPEAYYTPEIFTALDDLVTQGKIIHYGVSVERVEEGLMALHYPGVQSVQIIFNLLRQRPTELFFSQAKARQVGVIARVPLASGLLTGKLNADSLFAADDHRNFNRNGEAFDRGETFSGVDYETGLACVEQLRNLCPDGVTLPQLALRWILMHDAVTCAIPGARNPSQVESNASASDVAALSADVMSGVRAIYDGHVKSLVHRRW